MAPIKQIYKHKRVNMPRVRKNNEPEAKGIDVQAEKSTDAIKNKRTNKKKDMNEKVNMAEEIMSNFDAENVKVIKKDKGLIERTESSKIVLTEDNRQVLND